jgi:hypothetical protein
MNLLYFERMDFEIENELRPEMGKDEKLIWTGRPKRGVIFYPTDIFVVPFSLVWTGGVAVGFLATMRNGLVFPDFVLIPMLLFGCYLLFGRFLVDAQKRRNTIYGITDSRIIIKSGVFVRNITSFNIKALSDVAMRVKKNGGGSITLMPSNYTQVSMPANWPGYKAAPQLHLNDQVREVYHLILERQQR